MDRQLGAHFLRRCRRLGKCILFEPCRTSIKATGLVDALAIYVLYKFAMLDVIECNASGLGLPRQGMDDEPKAHCCAGGAAGLVGLAFVHALLANQRLIDHLLRLRNKCFR
jgi:hypothetical protein